MRTNTFVGYCLLLITILSIFFLVLSVFVDKRDFDDISSEDNFKQLINTENSFIMFYSQNKGRCPFLDENWKELVKTVEKDFNEVHVAKFDCSVFKPICEGIGVEEYPSLVWMKNGKIVDHFKGNHDAEGIKTYLFDMIKSKQTTAVRTALSSNSVNLKNDKTETSSESISSELVKKSPTRKPKFETLPKPATLTSVVFIAPTTDPASPDIDSHLQNFSTSLKTSIKIEKLKEKLDNSTNNDLLTKDGVYVFTTKASSESTNPDSNSHLPDKMVSLQNKLTATKKQISSDIDSLDKSNEDLDPSEKKIVFTGLNSSSPNDSHEVAYIVSNEKKVSRKGEETDDEETDEKFDETYEEEENELSENSESISESATKSTIRAFTTQRVLQILKSSKFKSKYLELSPGNFTENLNPNGVSLIMLYAPWCHFCDEMRDLLKLILLKHEKSSYITIGQMDCVNKDNEKFCIGQEMQGVPTINIYRNGELLLNDYHGQTFEELEDCLLSHMTDEAIERWEDREDEREQKRKQEKKKRQKEEKAANSTTTLTLTTQSV